MVGGESLETQGAMVVEVFYQEWIVQIHDQRQVVALGNVVVAEVGVQQHPIVIVGLGSEPGGFGLHDLDAFDLVIDTGKVSPALAADWIASVVRSWEESPPEGDGAADLEADPILDEYLATVRQGHVGEAMATAIDRCTELMAKHFPPGDHERNLLPDHLIQIAPG